MKLLIEIGVEELPAIPFLKELQNIKPKWRKILQEYKLDSEFEFEYTPRRMVFFHENFSQKQPDSEIVNIGAPKAVAIKDGLWTKAAISFANRCKIKEDELKFKEVDGKEVLYHKSIEKGKPSKDVLGAMIEKFIKSLNFGKSMRWADTEFEFIRPIRNIICLLDDENVQMQIYAVKSGLGFYPHRKFGYDKVSFKDSCEYFKLLEKNGVILSADKRRKKILSDFKEIEKSSGFNIEIDEDLLDEVVAITENPTALMGEFEKEFLEVPKEVIITSMKENQRYFPVFEGEKLSNHFVVVSNAITKDSNLIVKGNEKVLKARLSDAMFFWQSDLKSEFSANKLKNISYLKELGSVYDKELREREIARKLSKFYDEKLKYEFNGENYIDELDRAVMLSKADLLTGMVGEFSELQGIMGSYYAANKKEHPLVVRAIKEQYLPSGENSKLPKGIFSSVVAMSIKLDTLMGLFSVNKIPSGNKDPYALRRAASGLIKIVLNQDLNFDIKKVIKQIKHEYKEFDYDRLLDFIKDRLYTLYDTNPSVIKSCINSGENDIKNLNSAIIALDKISKAENFKENFSTFKRLANIIKDEKINCVNEKLLEHDAEISLNNAFKKLDLNFKNHEAYLNALFGLKDEINNFFDQVMINVDDKSLRENRINLIGQIYNAFLKVADIKEVSF